MPAPEHLVKTARRRGMKLVFTLLGLILTVLPTAGLQAQAYDVLELNPLPGDVEASATAINNLGKVVGISTDESGKRRAVTWLTSGTSPTTPVHLQAPENGVSLALAVNDLGQVVGQIALPSGDLHAALWQPNHSLLNLASSVPGKNSTALSINNRGDIAGIHYLEGVIRPTGFVLRDGQFFRVGEPGQQMVQSINDHRILAGVSFSSNETRGFLRYVRLLPLPFLSPLSDNALAQVNRINNANQVVGSALNADGDERAVLWQGASVLPLGDLGGNSSKALDLNHFNQIVGTSLIPPPTVPVSTSTDTTRTPASSVPSFSNEYERAFLWQNGVLTNLNTLISPSSGWVLLSATGINDRGQITGYGLKDAATGSQPSPSYVLRAYLLTPRPGQALSPAFLATLPTSGDSIRYDLPLSLALQSTTAVRFRVYLNGILVHTLTSPPFIHAFENTSFGLQQIRIESYDNNDQLLGSEERNITVRDIQLDEWKEKFFTSATAPEAGDRADQDGDAVVNLLEYAYDLDPTVPAPAPPLLRAESGVRDLIHKRRKARTSLGLNYDIEYSTNLGEWFTAAPYLTETAVTDDGDNAPTETATYRINGGPPAGPNVFFRIRVSVNP
jgi:uncharacterized membrane protein